jgi:hypothetical protein
MALIYEGDATICPNCGRPIEPGDLVVEDFELPDVVVHEGCR